MNEGIIIFDEVMRDGAAVSNLLYTTTEIDTDVITSLTKEQKILFLKYASRMEPEHFGFYDKDRELYDCSDEQLDLMVEELNWIWK